MDSITEQRFSIQKAVIKGATSEDKSNFLADVGRDSIAKGAEPIPGEKEKSAEDLALISIAKAGINSVRKKFGLEPFEVSLANIHILPGTGTKDMEPGTVMAGVTEPENQRVIAMEGRSRTESLDILTHELFHLASYGAMQIATDDETVDFKYRSGFTAHSRDAQKQYFHSVDEALTEMLVQEVVEQAKGNDLLAPEAEITKQILSSQNIEDSGEVISASYKNGSEGQVDVYRYKYPEQRKILDTLATKILERNPQRFTTKKEVYDLFMKGKLQGNFYEIGKIIDKTFGKSTFRNIGRLSNGIAPIEDYRKYVESL